MEPQDTFGKALIQQFRRRVFEESVPRLRKCLSQLSEEEIWQRPNEQTVSVGNLVLHLCGNARQYIICGLGDAVDARNRSQEFSERGPIPAEKLLATLDQTTTEMERTLEKLNPATLLEKRHVQGFVESGLSILVHVIEHFSYHTGQIAYIVKSRKNVNLGFYAGIDLTKTGKKASK